MPARKTLADLELLDKKELLNSVRPLGAEKRKNSKSSMTKQEFLEKMREIGYDTQEKFAEELGVSKQSVSVWVTSENFPLWLDAYFRVAIKAKKYEAVRDSFKELLDNA